MNIQFPYFVGRVEPLKIIQGQLKRDGETGVVNIAGQGGVGKTTLLRKVGQDVAARPSTLVTEVIDFSQTVHRVESWVLERLAQIKPDSFPTYHTTIRDIEKLEPLPRLYREEEACEAFIADYNRLARTHRILMLFDTVELVQETPLLDFILELVQRLENTVLILAGRFNDDALLVQHLNGLFDSGHVETLRLEGFTPEEATAYFAQTLVPGVGTISDNLRENIYILSEGNAIKIALSLDWLGRGIPVMPEITLLAPDDLLVSDQATEDRVKVLRRKFEYALMDGIRKFDSQLSKVILYMAHLDKRCNRRMLQFFFCRDGADDLDKQRRATQLISALKDLPFVKYVSDDYFVLHDEMVRLVTEHVWNTAEDPDRSLRRQISREACHFYTEELNLIEAQADRSEQDRVNYWSYRVERMYYQLDADFLKGYYEFEDLFERLVDDHRPGLAALTVKFLREFKDLSEFSPLLKVYIAGYYDGGVLLAQHHFEKARQTLTSGVTSLIEAEAQLEPQRIGPLDQHLRDRKYHAYHQLGFCFRSLGDWEKAVQYYQESLALALRLANEIRQRPSHRHEAMGALMEQVAETLNSLANVQRLVGHLHEARLKCQTGVLLRQKYAPDQVAKSQYVMGMILWEMGGTAEAMRYLHLADQACTPSDETTRALITKYRAYILYRVGLPQLAVPDLRRVEASLRRRGQFSEQADALNILSRIYRDFPDTLPPEQSDAPLAVAERLADEAHSIARRIGDQYRSAECYLTRSLHAYRGAHLLPGDQIAYLQEAEKYCVDGYDLALQGRYYQLLSQFSALQGDLAFERRAYDKAFVSYYEQCARAVHFKRAVYERSIDHLGERLRELNALDSVQAQHYAQQIINKWQADRTDSTEEMELIAEIQEIQRASEEKETSAELRRDYGRAMREGRWAQAAQICLRRLKMTDVYADPNRARIILDQALAIYRAGDLAAARRLVKVAQQIGRELGDTLLQGEAHLLLATVLWDTTSTAEAAENLDQAEAIFNSRSDKVGLARVKRLRGYVLLRTGFAGDSIRPLLDAAQIFRERDMAAELSDVWNLLSRIARTRPDQPDYPEAQRYADKAVAMAEQSRDKYRIAECYLSQTILVHRRGEFDAALKLYKKGVRSLSPEMHLLRSVYEGVHGSALLEKALISTEPVGRAALLDRAFERFGVELIEATQSKPVRLMRALDLILEALMRLTVEETQHYSTYLEGIWQSHKLGDRFPIVLSMCEQATLYRPYL